MLTVSKTLENMELGHNILLGQWALIGDPAIRLATWEWDFLTSADGWQRTPTTCTTPTQLHQHKRRRTRPRPRLHHPADEPRPTLASIHAHQPLYAALLAPVSEWGSPSTNWRRKRSRMAGRKSVRGLLGNLAGLAHTASAQFAKGHLLFPLLAAPSAVLCLLGSLTAKTLLNFWAHTVIFCGRFPDHAQTFTEGQIESETRGQSYLSPP